MENALKGAIFWFAFFGFILYWTSDNGQQEKYVGELEKVVAACLGEKEGALFVGGELHLCKAVPTGIKL